MESLSHQKMKVRRAHLQYNPRPSYINIQYSIPLSVEAFLLPTQCLLRDY